MSSVARIKPGVFGGGDEPGWSSRCPGLKIGINRPPQRREHGDDVLAEARDSPWWQQALSSSSWKGAMQAAGPWLYYNATAVGRDKQPRANLEGLPPSLVKGAGATVLLGSSLTPPCA